MHNFIRTTALVTALVCMAAPATAATQNEFYTSLLRRGVASYDATRYPDAAKQLRIAAFGMVDAIEHYQLAQMYLTLTYDKLGLTDRAREAAHRVTVAERVERKYAAVSAPQPVRVAFEVLAARLLSPSELAILRSGPAPPPAPVPQTTAPRPVQVTVAQQTSAAPAQTVTRPPAPKPQPVQQPVIATPAPQKTMPENAAPQMTTATKPVVKPTPAPVTATTGRGGPVVEPVRPVAPAPRPLTANEINTRLATAERALNGANLAAARASYRELLAAPGLDHDVLIRVAEGLYRARDFAAALNAFSRIGTLRRGEEPYRYYMAVAAYETGDYGRAKNELAAALPYIEITPDVARYRTRIEGAQ
jgi:hypothetical protein